uniref:Uncharacterized protein n=1 Tax=Picea glauca TaxID=3330 RepID=A0A117NH61_PICGL|nr:hypothetical protein ABT39_MTgene4866 [Picea glauca]QHR92368.1 hypothetical protein Q903MT_gene6411 [Picea sitchensis]
MARGMVSLAGSLYSVFGAPYRNQGPSLLRKKLMAVPSHPYPSWLYLFTPIQREP